MLSLALLRGLDRALESQDSRWADLGVVFAGVNRPRGHQGRELRAGSIQYRRSERPREYRDRLIAEGLAKHDIGAAGRMDQTDAHQDDLLTNSLVNWYPGGRYASDGTGR